MAHGHPLTRHHRADLRAQLLLGIGCRAEPLADTLDERSTIHPVWMAGRVSQLVQGGLVVVVG